jgi:molybdate transport system ATP-binding protein
MISIDIEKKLKGYGGQQWLKVKRDFATGGIVQISGPSGIGKTTFLKIIAGLVQPENGLIRVDGAIWRDTQTKINLSPQKRKTGFVFQDYALFPNMSVLQHLEYAMDDSEWIQRLLYIGKLETLSSRKPEYLSGGQQQRLAILRALANKPRILLMDEPFSALDQKMKSALIKDLKQLFKELGCTVFIVSHNEKELENLDLTDFIDFEDI